MVYRIETSSDTLELEGLLDGEALAGLARRCGEAPIRRIRLRVGTEIDPECVEPLLALGLEIVSDSPYLARWLDRARGHGGTP